MKFEEIKSITESLELNAENMLLMSFKKILRLEEENDELKAKLIAIEYLENSLQNAKKDANAYRELYGEALEENTELKEKLAKVDDTESLALLIAETIKSKFPAGTETAPYTYYLDVVLKIQQYIKGE